MARAGARVAPSTQAPDHMAGRKVQYGKANGAGGMHARLWRAGCRVQRLQAHG